MIIGDMNESRKKLRQKKISPLETVICEIVFKIENINTALKICSRLFCNRPLRYICRTIYIFSVIIFYRREGNRKCL